MLGTESIATLAGIDALVLLAVVGIAVGVSTGSLVSMWGAAAAGVIWVGLMLPERLTLYEASVAAAVVAATAVGVALGALTVRATSRRRAKS